MLWPLMSAMQPIEVKLFMVGGAVEEVGGAVVVKKVEDVTLVGGLVVLNIDEDAELEEGVICVVEEILVED